ncbi:hypothetical protein AAC387_Pa05g3524 [Persea americana]
MVAHIFVLVLFSIASSLVYASDPSPLQDICVADLKSKVLVNGFVCKDIKKVTAGDFFFAGLDKPGNTTNKVGSNVTTVNVIQIAGLNTLGISLVRVDYAPKGENPPHTHPRATEILTVLEGTLYVGFVLSNQNNNTLISKVLKRGDVFVFPIGLIHFQANIGHENAVAIAALSSQNPGVITIANAVFGSKPPISDNILARAFQVDKKVTLISTSGLKILVAYWAHFIESTDQYLKSLLYSNTLCSSSVYNKCAGKVEIKYYRLPGFNLTGPAKSNGSSTGNIYPGYSRVNHGKYAVSDVRAHIGTSNLIWDYFYTTAGVSFGTYNPAIVSQLQEIFEADWNSPYALAVEPLESLKAS